MTELLQQVIAQIEQLPLDRQDAIAARFLAELKEEQQADDLWVEDVREKIDAAILESEQTPPITSGTLRERWRNIRQPDFRTVSTRSGISMSRSEAASR
jgi:hypothetical protein